VLWGLVLLVPKVRTTVLPIIEGVLLCMSSLLFLYLGIDCLFLLFFPINIAVLFFAGVVFFLYRVGRSKNHDKRFSNGDNIYVWGVWALWSFGACLGFVVLPLLAPGDWHSSHPDPIFGSPLPFLFLAALLTLRVIWFLTKETRARQRYLLPLGGISSAFVLMLWLLVFYADDTLQLQLTKDCYQCDLSGADLSNRDLSGADLRGANLAGANLTGARLDGARLNWSIRDGDYWPTSLEEANLTGASLVGTNLEKARLSKANFTGADLREASFRGARGSNANFTSADLREAYIGTGLKAIYCDTTMPDGTYVVRDCILNNRRNALVLKGWHDRLYQSQPVRRTHLLAVSNKHIRDNVEMWCVHGIRNERSPARPDGFRCTNFEETGSSDAMRLFFCCFV
jgi:hypothetical protein